MTFDEYLAKILDPRLPVKPVKEAPELGGGRLELWNAMVDAHLPRDMSDPFSEAKVARDFTPEQLGYLRVLCEHDFSRQLNTDKLFGRIGVPQGLGARRVWLGFDSSISLSRPWSLEHEGAKRDGTLWQAIRVAYWWEEKAKKVKELLSELPQEELFDFFYRWEEMTFDKQDNDCEAVTEYGREFLAKYLKDPSKGLVAWAHRRAEEVRTGTEPEPEVRDTWLVLAVLASQLGKKASFSADHEALFLLGAKTVLDGVAGKKVWATAPEELRLRFLRTKLKPYLSAEMPDALVAQRFAEFKALPLAAMKLSGAERQVIYQAALRAWELDGSMFVWETAYFVRKAELEVPQSGEPGSESERALRAWITGGCPDGNHEQTKQASTSYLIVGPENLGELSEIEQAQLRAVGRQYFDRAGSESEIVRWGLERFIMFGRAKLMNRRGQRVGDAWGGFVRGRRFVGYLFEPDQPEPTPNVQLAAGDFVGTTRAAHRRAQQAELKARTDAWVEDRTAAARAALGL